MKLEGEKFLATISSEASRWSAVLVWNPPWRGPEKMAGFRLLTELIEDLQGMDETSKLLVDEPLRDQKLRCVGCEQEFLFAVGEQQFFLSKGFSPPIRCKNCRKARRVAEKESSSRGDKNVGPNR